MNKRTVGSITEQKAAEYLNNAGLTVIERNYRCRLGEIDIIAKDADGTLIFTEVKYRRLAARGLPEEAVSGRKQETIRRIALWYLAEKRLSPDSPMRFDVIAMDSKEIRWYRNAF